eukprot:3933516-Rhodomonas_salina.1
MHEALTGSKLSTREGDEGDERPRLSTVGKHRGKNGGAREEEMDARSREGGRTEHGGHHQAGKGGAVGGGGNHAHAQVEEVKAGVIMGDAGTCVREMAAIHRCANARWTNCTAATYWYHPPYCPTLRYAVSHTHLGYAPTRRCLQSLGAAPASYTGHSPALRIALSRPSSRAFSASDSLFSASDSIFLASDPRAAAVCTGLLTAGGAALVDGRHGKFLVNVNDMYIGASLYTYGEWSEEEVLVMSGMGAPKIKFKILQSSYAAY